MLSEVDCGYDGEASSTWMRVRSMKFEGFDRHAIISEDHPILGSQNSYLARLCECVVDIEQDHCVLDRTLVKRG